MNDDGLSLFNVSHPVAPWWRRLRNYFRGLRRSAIESIWIAIPDLPGRVPPFRPIPEPRKPLEAPYFYRSFIVPETGERRLPETEDEYLVAVDQWSQEAWKIAEPGLSKWHRYDSAPKKHLNSLRELMDPVANDEWRY